MKRPLSILGTLALAALLAVPAAAQTVEALLVQVDLESELLVDALARYRAARDSERTALARLADLSDQLDRQLERSDLPIEDLRRAYSELVTAGEIAGARLRETALARMRVYEGRQRLVVLEGRLAATGGGPLVPDSGVSGLWQVEVEPGEVFGLMRIQADGTLLAGTYVLSNGDQGSVRGTVIDSAVEIERIDASRGFIDTLQGDLDAPRGTLAGSWTANALTAGEPTTGTWTARRLARGLAGRPE